MNESRAPRRPFRRIVVPAVLGLALVAVGAIGFTVVGDRADRLAATGTPVTASIVGAATYLGGDKYSEHLDVAFTTTDGVAVQARVWIGEDFTADSGSVDIVYDPADPTHAQLAGDAYDYGPIGWPLIGALVAGLGLLVYSVVLLIGGLYALWRRRRREDLG